MKGDESDRRARQSGRSMPGHAAAQHGFAVADELSTCGRRVRVGAGQRADREMAAADGIATLLIKPLAP